MDRMYFFISPPKRLQNKREKERFFKQIHCLVCIWNTDI